MTQIPPRITALLNQKGGVGKTTSTVSIGAAIALLGRRTLLIDLDPQAHLSLHLGVDGSAVGKTVYDVLVDPDCDIRDAIVQVRDNLRLLPSTTDLAGAETELSHHEDRNRILRERFAEIGHEFDFVLIDCPPSLNMLTLNGLCLADEVLVPMQAQFLAMQGLTKLLETVQLLAGGLNPTLRIGGVVLCMHETQTSHSREVVQELSNFFDESAGSGLPWDGAKVLMPAIRRNIKLAEAPSFGQTIFDYAPWCPGAIDYRALAERFVRDWEVAHGVDPAIAGKPTPAAAAAAAATAAAAAAAAAAAVQSSRFTPETAAAARAARLTRNGSTPIIGESVVRKDSAQKPIATAPGPKASQVKSPEVKSPEVKSPEVKSPEAKSAPRTSEAKKPAPATAPTTIVEPRAAASTPARTVSAATPAASSMATAVTAATPSAKAKPRAKPETTDAKPASPVERAPVKPASASEVKSTKPAPPKAAPPAVASSEPEPEPIDTSHPFRAAARQRGG